MIINLRGTSGSGKSTIVRQVMGLYAQRIPFKIGGRKQPIGYQCLTPDVTPLGVVGHYETACGGCDTITSQDEIYSRIRAADDLGWNVLFEGVIVSTMAKGPINLHNEGRKVVVINLNTPLDLCVESINQRRRAKKADAPPVNPKNTIQRQKSIDSTARKMVEAGMTVLTCSRAEALAHVCSLLGLEVPGE